MSSRLEARSARIIVADDSRTYRNIVINTLMASGCREENLHVADSGTDVLDILDRTEIDLFLLDWNMPEPNGIELVKMIRGTMIYREIPIVMITSEAARYNVLEAIKAGVTDYLVKPITGKNLETKLKKFIQAGTLT